MRSIRPLAGGEWAGICSIPSSWRARPSWVGDCFPASCSARVQCESLRWKMEWRIAVEAERDAVGSDHGAQSAEIADGIFGFELEVSGEDLTGGIILKTDESEFGAAAFEPVMTAGVGEGHHAETRAGRASRTILPRPALLRRSQFGGPQDAAHGLPADGEVLFRAQFFRQMRIVEALILAAG